MEVRGRVILHSREKSFSKTVLKFMEVRGRVTSGAPPLHPAAKFIKVP
jgi:hypothetical protein